MKLNVLLCFGLVVVFSMKAQTWCPPCAIWSYNLSSPSLISQPRSGVINDVYQSDSLINGKLCKHIVSTFKGKDYPNSLVVVYNNYRESYTYENNKVIYVWAYSGLLVNEKIVRE